MRILVATDGSSSAIVACTAAASLPWPPRSEIRLLTVVGGADERDGLEDLRESRAATGLSRIRVDLRHGAAAAEIVAAAVEFDAELIVVGCRGWGPWATVPIGSVSAAVVDHAPCPVLVVRGPRLEPIVLGSDGSEDAWRAEALLRRWPRTTTMPVRVVSVRHRARLATAPADRATDDPPDASELATAAAARLAQFGVPAEPIVCDGDPADGLIAAAHEIGGGLIVVGTRGRTGLRRLVLGSVARKVLTHARTSVLVVRPAALRVPAFDAAAIPALSS